jgi:hypothetical protein
VEESVSVRFDLQGLLNAANQRCRSVVSTGEHGRPGACLHRAIKLTGVFQPRRWRNFSRPREAPKKKKKNEPSARRGGAPQESNVSCPHFRGFKMNRYQVEIFVSTKKYTDIISQSKSININSHPISPRFPASKRRWVRLIRLFGTKASSKWAKTRSGSTGQRDRMEM